MSDLPSRRTFLGTVAASGAAALAGCNNILGSKDPATGSTTTDDPVNGAHTVTVYLADREATRDVAVTVKEGDGTVVFERRYALSDENEADEDATFPESADPETVVVTVDGEQFERSWPQGRNQDEPCSKGNWEGVEVWVEGEPDESPSVRLEGNCQHVTIA
jgi:hypothetical protein